MILEFRGLSAGRSLWIPLMVNEIRFRLGGIRSSRRVTSQLGEDGEAEVG